MDYTKAGAGRRRGGLPAEEGAGPPSRRRSAPSPAPAVGMAPGRHGCGAQASDASRAAGAALLGVCWGGRLWLHPLPLPPRRYPRARAVKEGRRGRTGGTFPPPRAPRWKNNSATLTHWPGADARVCHDDPWGCRGHPCTWEPKDGRAGVFPLVRWCPLGAGDVTPSP